MTKLMPEIVTVQKSHKLTSNYYKVILGSIKRVRQCQPGQFVHLLLPGSGTYLRRAMSIAAIDKHMGNLEVIFRVVGPGTKALASCKKGSELNLLGPLGKKFSKPHRNEKIIMIAGGVGFPPLLYLATDLIAKGFDSKAIDFYYGGKTAEEIVERPRLKKLGVNFYPVTDDGSLGEKGLVTEALENKLNSGGNNKKFRIYTCGPEPMLKAVDKLGLKYNIPGELSLEAHMPCGYGVCLGCIVPLTAGGNARVCREGPIFKIGEVSL